MMINSTQKILAGIIMMVLIFSPISLTLNIKRSEAQLAVDVAVFSDVATYAYYIDAGTSLGIIAGEETLSTADIILKFTWKLAGQLLKVLVLNRLVDALTAYISGKSDVIIEDWDKFFDQAADDAIGLLAEKLTGGLICNNFDLNLRMLLLPVDQLSKGIKCSLSQIVGNIDSFINNFENGGWVAYQEQWYPQNNFYGTALTLLDERSLAIAKAKDTAQNNTSGGFLSRITCDPPGSNKNCITETPGSFIADQVIYRFGIQRDVLGILTANDIASYITQIANAGVNRLLIMGTKELRGLIKSKKSSEYSSSIPSYQNPCAGLTGDAFRACSQTRTAATATYQSAQQGIQNQFNNTIEPRREAANALSQLIISQTELVDNLSALAVCKTGDANIASQLTDEQSTLEDLQNKFDDNQTFLEPLEESSEIISGAGNNDWLTLSNQLVNNQKLLDPNSAAKFQSDIKNEKTVIQANVDSKLPGIKSQLISCPNAPKS